MKAGKLIDDLYTLRAKRIVLEHQVEGLKAKETAIKALLFIDLPLLGLDSASGKLATASIRHIFVPQVLNAAQDWPLLYAYIKKHDTFEMLHKRLSVEPFAERYARGEKVPGVAMVKTMKLNLSARKK